MIQLRYPVPGTDRTAYVLLDAVPSVCEPAPAHERSFQVDLKQDLEGYSASGIRVHRAEARYVLEYNEATQSVVLSLEGDVMLKVASGEKVGNVLRREAANYQRLRKVQGRVVPSIQGYFCVNIDNDVEMSVLVMEPWAPLPTRLLDHLPVSWRCKTTHALVKLHQAGLSLGVFNSESLVVKTDREGGRWPMFVNLARVYEHKCPFTGAVVEGYTEIPPDEGESWHGGCIDIQMAYIEADLWNPNYVSWFAGHNLEIEDTNISCDELVNQIMGKLGDSPHLAIENREPVDRNRMLQKAWDGLTAMDERNRKDVIWMQWHFHDTLTRESCSSMFNWSNMVYCIV